MVCGMCLTCVLPSGGTVAAGRIVLSLRTRVLIFKIPGGGMLHQHPQTIITPSQKLLLCKTLKTPYLETGSSALADC